MDSVIQSLKNLFTTYGFSAATIVLVTIVAVNLLKRPITSYALKFAKERGVEKSVITRYVTYLPFVIAVLLTLLSESVAAKFRFAEMDWAGLFARGLSYGALSIATYETVKKQLQAYAAKKNAETAAARAETLSLPSAPLQTFAQNTSDAAGIEKEFATAAEAKVSERTVCGSADIDAASDVHSTMN